MHPGLHDGIDFFLTFLCMASLPPWFLTPCSTLFPRSNLHSNTPNNTSSNPIRELMSHNDDDVNTNLCFAHPSHIHNSIPPHHNHQQQPGSLVPISDHFNSPPMTPITDG